MSIVAEAVGAVYQWVSKFAPSGYPTPIYKLEINGKGIGAETAARLISLTLRDSRGFEADQLDFELSDHDGALAFPDSGDLVKVWLGFVNTGLEYMGEYKIGEFNHAGAPDRLKITARAADLAATLAEQRDKSWHKTTLYDIVASIGASHGYTVKISEEFKEEVIAHIDQTSESDASFLTRLADQNDAISTIKNGVMLFIKMGAGETASGQPIPPVVITRADGDNHDYSQSDTANYQAVRAYYKTAKEGQRGELLVNETNAEPTAAEKNKPAKKRGRRKKGEKVQKTPPPPKIDTGGQKVKTLRHLYASYLNALRGARAAYKKLKRGVATFKISLAIGRPDLYPEMPAWVSGYKAAIDGQGWLITELSHKLDSNGLTTDISLEIRLDLGEDEEEGEDGAEE